MNIDTQEASASEDITDEKGLRWSDIHDPDHKIEVRATFHMLEGKFSPDTVQKMINDKGFPGMVKEVNAHLQANRVQWSLLLLEDILIEAHSRDLP